MDRATDALAAICVLSDLVASASDLHLVDPDALAMLLSRIAADLETSLERLKEAEPA